MPSAGPSFNFRRMGAEVRVDIHQLKAAAGRWSGWNSELAAPAAPWPGQAFQPTTAAVVGVHAAVDLAETILADRTGATVGLVAAGVDHYVENEDSAAGKLAGVVHPTVVS